MIKTYFYVQMLLLSKIVVYENKDSKTRSFQIYDNFTQGHISHLVDKES